MGTIVVRGGAYRAVVRLKGHETQTKTFSKKAHAKVWINETETALRNKEVVSRGVNIGDLFTKYINEVIPLKKASPDTLKAFRNLEKTTGDLYLADLNHE